MHIPRLLTDEEIQRASRNELEIPAAEVDIDMPHQEEQQTSRPQTPEAQQPIELEAPQRAPSQASTAASTGEDIAVEVLALDAAAMDISEPGISSRDLMEAGPSGQQTGSKRRREAEPSEQHKRFRGEISSIGLLDDENLSMSEEENTDIVTAPQCWSPQLSHHRLPEGQRSMSLNVSLSSEPHMLPGLESSHVTLGFDTPKHPKRTSTLGRRFHSAFDTGLRTAAYIRSNLKQSFMCSVCKRIVLDKARFHVCDSKCLRMR